ncbi:STAS domain-containing protein [Amycolatopsis sp. NPDC051373]|uniref:STAS domain-containing protein n=1 Tax=Amycolatopsis sp. NPDC051373 TaxID=3155801 RepID=UPI0034501F69
MAEPLPDVPANPPVVVVFTTAEDTTVVVRGDVDATIAGRLAEQLAVELELRPQVLLIDLREVTFCSSDGISTLVRAHEAARAAAVPYAIVTGRLAVLRPLRMLGLDRVLQVHHDLSDAKAWLGIVSRLRS